MTPPEVIEWSYALQTELEKMTQEEFKQYMEGKVIRMDGKLYGIQEEVCLEN